MQEKKPNSPGESLTPVPQTRLRNLIVAVAAIGLGIALFLGVQTQTQVPSLANLAEEATPLDLALTNGKPTLMEFYADWCTSCQVMAPMMAELEEDYSDRVNFVMLNVDNDKWLPEVSAYKVDGIPHFIFLDGKANPVGQSIGEQPRSIMSANLEALATNQPLPNVLKVGRTSAVNRTFIPPTASTTDPRSHSAQVVPRS
jgi:thiol-disulfide isomerase/thioredoxin